MHSDSASVALLPPEGRPRPLTTRLVLKLPAQEQLAALPPDFRLAPHRLLLRLREDPFGGSVAVADPRGLRRVLDTAGYWIVYRVVPGEPLAVVVEAIRRRRGADPAQAPPVEVEDLPVHRERGPAGRGD